MIGASDVFLRESENGLTILVAIRAPWLGRLIAVVEECRPLAML